MSKKLQIVGSLQTPIPDWNQADEAAKDYIKNKPELGELAAKDLVAQADLTSDIQASLEKADAAVTHSAQELTDEQKTQARENIGAASVDDVVDMEIALDSKSDSTHNHDEVYDAKGAAADVQANLNTVGDRVTALETWHTNFTEVSEEEINALFA